MAFSIAIVILMLALAFVNAEVIPRLKTVYRRK